MAVQSVATTQAPPAQVQRALARLTRVQGVLFCATKTLDEHLVGSPEWEISEALYGAQELLSECYSTLSDALAEKAEG